MNERLVAEVVRRVVAALDGLAPEAVAASSGPASSTSASSTSAGGGSAAVCSCGGRRGSVAPIPAHWPPKRVALGSDHGGFDLKEEVKRFVTRKGFDVVDCGTHSKESVDYPDYAAAVAMQVSQGKCQAGVVIDGTGIGSGMAANKVPGVRCAVCHDVATILNSREHNDANVLSIGSGVVGTTVALRMVDLWLKTPVGAERHVRRVRKIMELEG